MQKLRVLQRKGKEGAQQTSKAALAALVPTKDTLTPEQITITLAQLLESQR